MSQKMRVRFAPSPTGPLHIGGVRTALYNYLLAKQNKGTFILRIEDTDQTRYVENAEEYIKEALDWCGLTPDEGPGIGGDYGPYRQSERKHLYKKYADQLVNAGKAYYAFDTPDELNVLRKEAEINKSKFIYNGSTRDKLRNSLSLSKDEVDQLLKSGAKYVIRFKIPSNQRVKFYDEIVNDMDIDSNVLDDKILFKSDGMPTYHLANIVDDHLMEITHVIRGVEWLPSLALHHLLYEAFGWEAPKFAHLPLILKPVGKGKLSKRDGAKFGFPVFPLAWEQGTEDEFLGFKEFGFEKEAFINFLAFLGWNPGTEDEILSKEDLIEQFSLLKVNKSGARFDWDKAKWYNQQYLIAKDNSIIAKHIFDLCKQKKRNTDISYVENVVALMKERVIYAKDIVSEGYFFFEPIREYDVKSVKKRLKPDLLPYVRELFEKIKQIEPFTSITIENEVKNFIKDKELSFGKILPILRISFAGTMKGPDLFKMMEVLGKKEIEARIILANNLFLEIIE